MTESHGFDCFSNGGKVLIKQIPWVCVSSRWDRSSCSIQNSPAFRSHEGHWASPTPVSAATCAFQNVSASQTCCYGCCRAGRLLWLSSVSQLSACCTWHRIIGRLSLKGILKMPSAALAVGWALSSPEAYLWPQAPPGMGTNVGSRTRASLCSE